MNWIKDHLLLIVVGILLVFAVFSVKLIQNPYQYNPSETNRIQSQLSASDTPANTGVVANPIKPTANPEPTRNEWRSERDLEAQADMAKWAKYMFFVSTLMAALSAGGIFLIYKTLRETQRATKSAREGAKAAWEAVEATKIGVKAEFQPYLKVSDLNFVFAPLEDIHDIVGSPDKPWRGDFESSFVERDGELLIDAYVFVENKGRSPAYDLFYNGDVDFIGFGSEDNAFSKMKISCRFAEQLEAGDKIKLSIRIAFKATNPSKLPKLWTADSVSLNIYLRFSFLDYMSGSKRRVYHVYYMGSLDTQVIKKDNFAECGPNEKDNPPKTGIKGFFGPQTIIHLGMPK